MNEILNMYPNWTFNFDYDQYGWTGYAMAGDTNCPISKEYDPSDGHGFSSISVDNSYPTIEDCAKMLIEGIRTIVPGAPLKAKI